MAITYLSGQRVQGLYNVFTAWDITDSAYASKSFSVSSYFAELGGIAFKTDGTKMYVSDYTADTVSEFTLDTAWDITTATYVAQHSFTSTDNALTGVFFKSDGTKIFVVGLQNDTVYEFPLSSAWDITSVGSLTDSHSISSQESNPYQLFFKPDGLTMYVIGGSNNVNQYTLNSAWDLSGTVTHYKTFSVSSQDTGMIGLQFSSDGTKMFTAGYTNDKLYQYTLGTAWDLNGTVTYDSAATFTPTESETHPCGIFFNSNGGEFFILGTGQDTVYQYHTKRIDDKTTVTDVPVGSEFEQTDNYKSYQFDGASWVERGSAILPPAWSSLGAWYDASDLSSITKDESNLVSAWNDKKGSANLSDNTAKPLWVSGAQNGKDIIDFASSKDMVTASLSAIAQPQTWYIVMTAPNAVSGTRRPTNMGNQQFFTSGDSNRFSIWAGEQLNFTDSSLGTTQFYIWTLRFNGSSSEMLLDNSSKVTGDVGTGTSGTLNVGGSSDNADNKFGEILRYDGTLTSAENTSIYNYLKNRWGL